MAATLSVNVNKVATVRNSRGGSVPSVLEAVRVCLDAGVRGITVHPRADARHITYADVRAIAALLTPLRGRVELNIEGDPRPDLLDLVLEVRPAQCTLVPVHPGEVTSQAGWQDDAQGAHVAPAVARLKAAGVRTSLFVDPDPGPIAWAASQGADRVELYTEPYAAAWGTADQDAQLQRFAAAAQAALDAGLGVNAGHDLNLVNLAAFARKVPGLREVSIGHALIADALEMGYADTVRAYRACLV